MAGAYPYWTADEDARLIRMCHGKVIRGEEGWLIIADEFPGRSLYAVRQRHLTLRYKASGIKRQPRPRHQRPKHDAANALRKRTMPAPPMPSRPACPMPASLTAWIFGDPLPGRSALDQRNAVVSA